MGRYDKLTELVQPPSVTQPQVKNVSTSPSSVLLETNPVPPVLPVRGVRPVLPVPPEVARKRVMKQRHPFDIYRDQYEALQEISLEERRQGGVGSMSAIVREAIDKAIADRRRK
jgi:hypothetical protein